MHQKFTASLKSCRGKIILMGGWDERLFFDLRPKHVKKLYQGKSSLVPTDSILQGTLVEEIGGKLGQLRVHTVLYLQSEWSHV